LVEQAKRFDGLKMPAELERKFLLLKLQLVAPAPKDPKLRKELTAIAVSLDSDYGKGKFKDSTGKVLDINEVENIMAEDRDPARLKEIWLGWHSIGAPMRERYARFVDLSNQGARELGFKDTGVLWRAGYDMPPEKFATDVDRLWEQVRPLYLSLYTFVRARLSQKYGPQVVPPDGPIPAHLLAIPGRSNGATSTPCWGFRKIAAATISPHCCAPRNSMLTAWSSTARISTPRSHLRRCPRHSGSARFSPSLPIAKSSATPAPGISTTRMTCGSRCVFRSRMRTSSPFTTNWGTTSISAPTRTSRSFFRMVRTMASMRRSGTRLLWPSRRSI